ncbi:MAG TPA: acyltransferase domain-containing protein [Bacteroidales bacterium]|nr:acyltransferase domain-containing protein [Bacteroidales bacterium]
MDPFPDRDGFLEHFRILLDQASSHTGYEVLHAVTPPGVISTQDELTSQLLTYVYSSALSDYFRESGRSSGMLAGYSMGIYAAGYYAGSLAFTDGLDVILEAFRLIRDVTRDNRYGMASVIGLGEKDVVTLAGSIPGNLEITNRNNPVAFVVSGEREYVTEFTRLALEEGALHVRLMHSSFPYHSRVLQPTRAPFTKFVEALPVREPHAGILSLIDQTLINSAAALKKELVRNLFMPLDWHKTQLALMGYGIRIFVEMGPEHHLVKNSRFIPGDFRFLSAPGYLETRGQK